MTRLKPSVPGVQTPPARHQQSKTAVPPHGVPGHYTKYIDPPHFSSTSPKGVKSSLKMDLLAISLSQLDSYTVPYPYSSWECFVGLELSVNFAFAMVLSLMYCCALLSFSLGSKALCLLYVDVMGYNTQI